MTCLSKKKKEKGSQSFIFVLKVKYTKKKQKKKNKNKKLQKKNHIFECVVVYIYIIPSSTRHFISIFFFSTFILYSYHTIKYIYTLLNITSILMCHLYYQIHLFVVCFINKSCCKRLVMLYNCFKREHYYLEYH